MQIIVRDNNVDQALRALKKKLQREGVYREMKPVSYTHLTLPTICSV